MREPTPPSMKEHHCPQMAYPKGSLPRPFRRPRSSPTVYADNIPPAPLHSFNIPRPPTPPCPIPCTPKPPIRIPPPPPPPPVAGMQPKRLKVCALAKAPYALPPASGGGALGGVSPRLASPRHTRHRVNKIKHSHAGNGVTDSPLTAASTCTLHGKHRWHLDEACAG